MAMTSFSRIGVIAWIRNQEVLETLEKLVAFLTRKGFPVMVERNTATFLKSQSGAWMELDDINADEIDLVIVVGGDGSMLSAIRALAGFDIPLLGVNRGRLGFLTDISPEQLENAIGRVLAGEYQSTARFLLEAQVWRGNIVAAGGKAAHDGVLHPGHSVRMMEFELYVDGQFVYSQHSDGLIMATPTGSTAYALSAGGPILQPHLDAIVLVPMNPHSLSSRPLVIDGSSQIEIRVGTRGVPHPTITCDGQREIGTDPDDVIRVSRMKRPVQLIHPVGHDFYHTCPSKLGWGSRLDSVHHENGSPGS